VGSIKINRFLTVMNRKDRKTLFEAMKEQFGVDKKLDDVAYLVSNRGKVYCVSHDIRDMAWESFRIDRAGVYVGKWLSDGFRPSMEGSKRIGPYATKNIIRVNKQGVMNWLKGRNIKTQGKKDGFYLVRYNDDFLGSGKLKNDELINGVSKSRKTTTLIL